MLTTVSVLPAKEFSTTRQDAELLALRDFYSEHAPLRIIPSEEEIERTWYDVPLDFDSFAFFMLLGCRFRRHPESGIVQAELL